MVFKKILSRIFLKKKFFIKEELSEIEIEPEPDYIVDTFYDDNNVLHIVHIVCMCGWSAAHFPSGGDGYWCEHCDRPCSVGLPLCGYCETLVNSSVEEIRRKYEEEHGEED